MQYIRTSHERERGCGWRKPGGLYLISDAPGHACDLLPVELTTCPTCNSGIKPARGWTWISPDPILNPRPHGCGPFCPLGAPGRLGDKCGLLWCGEQFYPTPQDWLTEAAQMGISRRLPAIPKGLVLGEHWVLMAHRKAIYRHDAEEGADFRPGIFHVFKPNKIEYVVSGDESEEDLDKLVERGVELVRVVPVVSEEVPSTAGAQD